MTSASTKRVAANEDVMEITPLGAGQEVGRSCVLMTFKGKQVLFDAGVHPAYTGLACLPYFDMIDDPSKIDVLLVTHFHLDHCASVPYFTEKVRSTHRHTHNTPSAIGFDVFLFLFLFFLFVFSYI